MNDPTQSIESNLNWSGFQKTAFRFCFIFFILNTFPFPLSELPVVGEFIKDPYENAWNKLVNVAGKLFFGIPEITIRPNGSGDTTWNWVQLFLTVVFAAIGSLIWYFLDKKRPNYKTLDFWNTIYLRYFLALTMLTYGIAKIVPSQFGVVTNYNLNQQLGDMSPMRLLWVFMAYSTKYQFFAGFMESLAGVLLIFRRTTLLGALISIGVMVNVFAMNMCFDVPVKIFSFMLILIGMYLAAPDFQRLLNFFILQKSTEGTPQYQPAFLDKKGYKIGRIVLKTLLILGFVVPVAMEVMDGEDTPEAPTSAFYGRYAVAKHVKNAADVLVNDTLRWENLLITQQNNKDYMIASNDMGFRNRMVIVKNDSAKTITFNTAADSTKYVFHFQQPDTSSLILSGKVGNDSLHVELLKQKKKDFLLVKRGFHWINEGPFNK
jgi:hypothetical protein